MQCARYAEKNNESCAHTLSKRQRKLIAQTRIRKRDLIKSLFKRIANLSLQDYYWRSDIFKKTEADRRVEESLAIMMGEEPAYVRPMDASDSKIGPLVRLISIWKVTVTAYGKFVNLSPFNHRDAPKRH